MWGKAILAGVQSDANNVSALEARLDFCYFKGGGALLCWEVA